MSCPQNASQTAGPDVHIGCTPSGAGAKNMYDGNNLGADIFPPNMPRRRIVIAGQVFDGAGDPVLDAMLEFWQADATGRYGANGPAGGWARRAMDSEASSYRLETILPAATEDAAAHVKVLVVARGINLGLHTQIYFEDAPWEQDPILLAMKKSSRRSSLIAKRSDDRYILDIHLQGDKETVFLNV
ncbi:protocatechuate 3,4-dioxygenase subunit alpha [Planktomarina sp.]|jgi:protocatechuate 3,4-dioxygenase alpha subunit|nr:protocatechuate 3,4-dioxygenase subunit alpha [Planktomarina sp.]MDB4841681.1 protocatechuate 3,4-dioxygenase subunit alpha [Planktomarina sp.]